MKEEKISRARVALCLSLLAAPAALGLAAGCSVTSGSICNDMCDCIGCSDSELDDCIGGADQIRQKADDKGCGDQYSTWLGCVSDQLWCREDKIDADGCETEAKEASKCMGTYVGLGFGD